MPTLSQCVQNGNIVRARNAAIQTTRELGNSKPVVTVVSVEADKMILEVQLKAKE